MSDDAKPRKRGRPKGPCNARELAQRRGAAWKHGGRATSVLRKTVHPCREDLCPLEFPCALRTAAEEAGRAIRDRRRYAGRSRVLTLRGAPPAGPGVIQQLTVTDDQLWLERVVLRASDNGGGSAGQTRVDVERTRDGVTVSLYPGSATDDQRPVIAFDAGVLIHDSGIPEVSDLRYGDVVTFRTVEHPTGGVPSELELQLVCRKE